MRDHRAIETASRELDELIEDGERIVASASRSDVRIQGDAISEVMAWASRSGHVIRLLAGEGSSFETTFLNARGIDSFSYVHSNHYSHLYEIQGALKGLRAALKAGLFQNLTRLLQADIFADFLEMAEHLLSQGYKDAAAVIIGGVLEDALRKLSQGIDLSVSSGQGKPLTIEPMNVNLAKVGIYPPLTKKQITSWADLRNNAAHGNYSKYADDDVKEMLRFVQRFSADFLQ